MPHWLPVEVDGESATLQTRTGQAYGITGVPETFIISRNGNEESVASREALYNILQEAGRKGLTIQRYKGLGEMNPEQLWESTMDPERRHMYRVELEDEFVADEIFTILMSPGVEARREYIERHALEATNLDV